MLPKGQLLRGSTFLMTLVASTGIAGADDEADERSCAPPEGTCPPVAQAEPPPAPELAPPPPSELTYVAPESIWKRYGVELTLGGGVEGFTSDSARQFTNDGGAWSVRAGFGNRYPLSAEVSYIGSAQSLNALGLGGDAILVGNGAQGVVRVNFTTDMDIQPFAYAGAAWRHYDVTNSDFNTSDIQNSDDVLEIPAGAGLALSYRGFLFDMRGEFRLGELGDLMPSLNPSSADDRAQMSRWGVNANAGYQF